MKKYSTIIWDFNGTIIDDVTAALGAVNDMLIRRNQNPIDLDTYYKSMGVPIWKFYERVFLPGTITPQEAIAEFDSGYEKHLSKNPLMEGIVEILSLFKSMGKHQIVVSASHVDKVKARLSELKVLDFFSDVLAHSDYNADSKTYLAREYFKSNNLDLYDAVVIGDSVFDFTMASELQCDCILTTQGHQSRREFSTVDAQIIDSLYELKNIIE